MPRPSTITPAKLVRIREMGRRGVPQREIAAAVGLTQSRISQLLRGQGKRAKLGGEAAAARDQAIRQAARKIRVWDIAQVYGLTPARIYQILAQR